MRAPRKGGVGYGLLRMGLRQGLGNEVSMKLNKIVGVGVGVGGCVVVVSSVVVVR